MGFPSARPGIVIKQISSALKSSGRGHWTKSKSELGVGGKDGLFDDIKSLERRACQFVVTSWKANKSTDLARPSRPTKFGWR